MSELPPTVFVAAMLKRRQLLCLALLAACGSTGALHSDSHVAQTTKPTTGLASGSCNSDPCRAATQRRIAAARQAQLSDERLAADRAAKENAELMSALHRSEAAEVDAAFWCFEGAHRNRAFGQCALEAWECSVLMARRIEAGLTDTRHCRPFAQAACFYTSESLEKLAQLYCFPATAQCDRAHGKAVARGFEATTSCEIYGG